ncbi:MAG: transglycosylase SLT domain-containing protein [Panacagrimonas sp.]
MFRTFTLSNGLVLGLIFSAAAWPQADPLAAPRAEFVSALADIASGLAPVSDSDALRDYPLYPYLEAERLRWRLANAVPDEIPDDAIAAFLILYGDAPWTRPLRADWLRKLATRGEWDRFLRHYLDARADAALRCHQLSAQIATGPSAEVLAAALKTWRTGSELPAACTPVTDWLRSQDALTLEELATRTRLALEAGKLPVARMLIAQLPEEQRPYYALWADTLDDPARNLDRALAGKLEERALFDGFARLARKNDDAAAAALARIEAACPQPCRLVSPATPAELRREVALNHAWNRDPTSVAAFREVPESGLDERAQEWRVRAALWAGDWAQAGSWIAAMPPALAEQPRWRYWRARAAEKLERHDEASAAYQKLAQDNGYYSALAAERLGKPFTPRSQPRPGNAESRAGMDAIPAFVRSREAWRIDQGSWARTEWNDATASFDAANLLEAARLASTWGWHLMAVATATRAEVFDDYTLLYPRPYEAEVLASAKRVNLLPEWLWGVMRQESLYDPRARSSANALGLLQLLPETARAVARRNGLQPPAGDSLFDPPTNILLGATYLREQYDRFGGRLVMVLGAYNAGPNAVQRWLPPQAMDADVWIENIPYNETRNYIQRIVWHSTVFGWLGSGKPQRITPLLATIAPDITPLNPTLLEGR